MDKRLTVCIVTADRSSIIECTERLAVIPSINKVNVLILDNSTMVLNLMRSQDCGVRLNNKGVNCRVFHAISFIDCRNMMITESDTDFITVLDDDDYLSMDSIELMLKMIDENPEVDFFSYNVEKEGRIDKCDNKSIKFKSTFMKYWMLNKFDNYETDRTSKIYLWNCAIVFNRKLIKPYAKWSYIGCDDILPITNAYLDAEVVMKINHPVYYYPVQTGVTSKKDQGKLAKLEKNMYYSYKRLMGLHRSFMKLKILSKAVKNSIRQLEVIDNYEPRLLKTLLKK